MSKEKPKNHPIVSNAYRISEAFERLFKEQARKDLKDATKDAYNEIGLSPLPDDQP